MRYDVLFWVLIYLTIFVKCENILMLMGVPATSHHTWFRTLANGLAKNGMHNVTIISTELEKNPQNNTHYIHLDVQHYMFYESEVSKENLISINKKTAFGEIVLLNTYSDDVCTGIFKSTGIQTILNYPNDFIFDLIIYDYTCGPCLLFLLDKFNYPPLIGATAFGNPPYTLDLIGGHKYYAYIPYCGLYYDVEMNFWQRFHNVLIHAFSHIHRKYVLIPKLDKLVRDSLNQKDFPYLGRLETKAVLALVNTDFTLDFPEPLSPNLISVGGLHIREPEKLPDDIENFINEAEKGAVLFSLGTNIRSDLLGADIQTKLLEAFRQMPQYHFLWKFETDTLPVKPPRNVLIKPWIPQNDILAHNKTKAFISHGGLLSTQETTWHGVPIIGMPFVIDQHRNLFKAKKAGVAEIIDFQTLTTQHVRDVLLRVLEIPSYKENMKLRSAKFRDQKEKPLERALWWINWILRNTTPDHIQSPVIKLGLIKAGSWDIFMLIMLLILVLFIGLYKFIYLFRNKRNVKQKTN